MVNDKKWWWMLANEDSGDGLWSMAIGGDGLKWLELCEVNKGKRDIGVLLFLMSNIIWTLVGNGFQIKGIH